MIISMYRNNEYYIYTSKNNQNWSQQNWNKMKRLAEQLHYDWNRSENKENAKHLGYMLTQA